jgi:hypothetical protein
MRGRARLVFIGNYVNGRAQEMSPHDNPSCHLLSA